MATTMPNGNALSIQQRFEPSATVHPSQNLAGRPSDASMTGGMVTELFHFDGGKHFNLRTEAEHL
jgi:hypothetical protein